MTRRTTPALDSAGRVRDGEQPDTAALDRWLRANIEGLAGAPVIRQFHGGASNWTYHIAYRNRDLVLRRAPVGTKARGAHDMAREFRIQRALRPVYRYVPRMLAYCADRTVIGSEFYVMEKLDGIILRREPPPGLALPPQQARTLCYRLLDCLIELHDIDYRSEGLAELAPGAGYLERQIEGWSRRYRAARTWNVPRAEFVMRWLADHLPADELLSLIHNDFRLDNAVLDAQDPTRIIAILDWEMATIGDPRMDLGNTLAYWIQADDDRVARSTRRQPTHLDGMLTRAEVVAYYGERRGIDLGDFRYFEVYGLFRLAAIVQQIYFRYHRRETRNPAFRHFWLLATYLIWRSSRLIRSAR